MVFSTFSYRSDDVVATPERVFHEHGYRKTIRVDQGLSSSRAISTYEQPGISSSRRSKIPEHLTIQGLGL